jgi:transcriptional regulator with GAF, ATPase, and Fis domain
MVFSVEQYALLFELSRSFSSLIELEVLLPAIITKTRDVMQAENCALLFLDEAHQELYFPVTSDISPAIEARFTTLRFPAHLGIAGWVLQQGRPELVLDVEHDVRHYPAVDQITGAQTRDLLYAPLRTSHGIIGVISLRNKRGGQFTTDDLTFLETLAGPIAIAIENARLYQDSQHSEARLREEVAVLYRERARQQRFPEIIGTAVAMAKVFTLLENAIASPVTVLLQGETGTGKELLARAIHAYGARKDRPFVTVNCGALPETLIESELFGHAKGAFTGALRDQAGLFETAHGGTIFLDEIGETTPAMQVKLLRVLQEGEIRRVGETRPRRVDVRVITATNKDLAHEVEHKRFRHDLYYRLSVFPITVPPLRDRREDIPILVAHFLRRSSQKLDKPMPGLTPEAMAPLSQYHWPGNVRELENEIERAVVLAPAGATITPTHLSERLLASRALRVAIPPEAGALQQARLAFEREYIAAVLRQQQGNATQAAKVLGLSRQMLQRKIKAYQLRA